jgi:hypothetical protein
MKEKVNIPAIQDEDLRNLLVKHNLYDSFENGKLTCSICETVISYENLFGIQFNNSSLKLICDSSDCNEMLKEVDNG